jgi:hypothetical protein
MGISRKKHNGLDVSFTILHGMSEGLSLGVVDIVIQYGWMSLAL